MLGRTHLLFGVLIVVIVVKYFSSLFSSRLMQIISLCLIMLISIFPDIDEQKSILGRKLKPFSYAMTHRGFFHSILFIVLVVIIIFSFNKLLSIVVLIAFLGHLLLDALTQQGITPFWPFKWRIKGFLKTGGFWENIFALLLVIIIVITVFV